jgi:L-2-hydroxyglutarate oxidase LhgO
MSATDEPSYQALVVGAGVVGLASACALARRGLSVAVVERHARVGQETSSRNSGVIHAGLYYPPGSLKARLCVEGRDRLYARCASRGIAHRRTGKLVVAVDEAEVPALEELARRARENGAGEVELLGPRELSVRAPGVRAQAGLYSPLSGIVDVHGLMADLAAELGALGGDLVLATDVCAIEREGERFRVTTELPGGERSSVLAERLVNAAGLDADRVSALAGVAVEELGYVTRPCKGDYFVLSRAAPQPPVPLLYPLPSGGGLGIHLTTDLGGQVLAGPDSTWIERARSADLGVDESKADVFAHSVSRYLPGVRREHLTPGYAGLRPKLSGPGEPARDFVVEEASAHGVPGLVQLFGIESPGLTAALALAERVADLVGEWSESPPIRSV